jgi:hypothetical protein
MPPLLPMNPPPPPDVPPFALLRRPRELFRAMLFMDGHDRIGGGAVPAAAFGYVATLIIVIGVLCLR